MIVDVPYGEECNLQTCPPSQPCPCKNRKYPIVKEKVKEKLAE